MRHAESYANGSKFMAEVVVIIFFFYRHTD